MLDVPVVGLVLYFYFFVFVGNKFDFPPSYRNHSSLTGMHLPSNQRYYLFFIRALLWKPHKQSSVACNMDRGRWRRRRRIVDGTGVRKMRGLSTLQKKEIKCSKPSKVLLRNEVSFILSLGKMVGLIPVSAAITRQSRGLQALQSN